MFLPLASDQGSPGLFSSFLILCFILHPFYTAMSSSKEDVPQSYNTARLSRDHFRKDFRFASLGNQVFCFVVCYIEQLTLYFL